MKKAGKRSRIVEHNDVVYLARREGNLKDGCEPPRQWYWVVEDPKLGCCIDERVPDGYWSTLAKARIALDRFLGILTGDTITDDQIRELGGSGASREMRRLAKVALNDAPTYLKADVVRKARERCACIINTRSTDINNARKVAATIRTGMQRDFDHNRGEVV